jgi:hypothetical protein
MNPSVYLFRMKEQRFELCLSEYSTLDGLACFDPECEVRISQFGATNYQRHGWATEQEIPELKNVASIISFLKTEEDIGLVEFEAEIKGIGLLSTHDDSECHFEITQKSDLISILKKAAPIEYFHLILSKLLENPNHYLTFDELGQIERYETFDAYLSKNA